jgi:hypothetical protein
MCKFKCTRRKEAVNRCPQSATSWCDHDTWSNIEFLGTPEHDCSKPGHYQDSKHRAQWPDFPTHSAEHLDRCLPSKRVNEWFANLEVKMPTPGWSSMYLVYQCICLHLFSLTYLIWLRLFSLMCLIWLCLFRWCVKLCGGWAQQLRRCESSSISCAEVDSSWLFKAMEEAYATWCGEKNTEEV